MTGRRTGRWEGALAVGGAVAAAGVALGDAGVVLASTVGFAYAVYGYATRVPRPLVAFDRAVSDTSPAPGASVEVAVTVENVGDAALPDLRVIDGVPPALEVLDGSPRASASLQPGESISFSYTLATRRGHHTFEPATVECHNVSGSGVATEQFGEPVELSVRAPLSAFPLSGASAAAAGQVPTDEGGEGVEFYSVRDYRPGDPPRRIDWRRYARTGALRTVEYRETRAATVVVIVDTREAAWRAPEPDEPSAVALGQFAAAKVADARLDANDRVGAALFGETAGYVAPGVGREQTYRVRRFLQTGVESVTGESMALLAGGVTPGTDGTGGDGPGPDAVEDAAGTEPAPRADGGEPDRDGDRRGSDERPPGDDRSETDVDDAADADDADDAVGAPDHLADVGVVGSHWSRSTLRARLPDGARLVWVSPCLDDEAVELARWLSARGYATTVVSPDVTGDTVGGRLARFDRERRLRDLREHGIHVVDWSPREPVQVAVDRATRRWSA